MTSGENSNADVTGESDGAPRTYDFTRPNRLSKEQIKRVDYLHTSLAKRLSVSLAGLVRDYVEVKLADAARWNEAHRVGAENPFNWRQLTNMGVFRAYVINYLRGRPDVHQEGMTLLVRQLAPSPTGLPLEIYAFTKTVEWPEYEAIQADVFDHLVAAMGQFDLRVFQEPTGMDFQALAGQRGFP